MASLAAARADNFYYPPEWTPKQGSLNKFHDQHALRERARKLDQGILIISSVGDGSNAILLPGKKKSDSKHMRKVLDKRKLKKVYFEQKQAERRRRRRPCFLKVFIF